MRLRGRERVLPLRSLPVGEDAWSRGRKIKEGKIKIFSCFESGAYYLCASLLKSRGVTQKVGEGLQAWGARVLVQNAQHMLAGQREKETGKKFSAEGLEKSNRCFTFALPS